MTKKDALSVVYRMCADVEKRLRENNPVEAFIELRKIREFVLEEANA